MKTLFQLFFLALLAGCTQTENPLIGDTSEPDLYLVGKWYFAGLDENGAIVPGLREDYLDVELHGDDFRMTFYEGEKKAVFELVTTRIGPSRYVSMQVIEAIDEDYESELEGCPYQVMAYQTYIPNPLPKFDSAADEGGKLDAASDSYEAVVRRTNAELRGNLVFAKLMDSEFIYDAISDDVVAGYRDNAMSSPCITATPEALRAFVAEHHEPIYLDTDWIALIRATN